MTIGNSGGPNRNSVSPEDRIIQLQQLVGSLVKRNNEHMTGIKTALSLVMLLMKEHMADDEFMLVSSEELIRIAEETVLNIDEMTMDSDPGETLISVSLKTKVPQKKPPFIVINAEGTSLADSHVHSENPN